MQQDQGQQPVKITSTKGKLILTALRAGVAALAAGAGALATVSVGDNAGIESQQYWAALAAAAAAFGGVIGVRDRDVEAVAPSGELDKMRAESNAGQRHISEDRDNGNH